MADEQAGEPSTGDGQEDQTVVSGTGNTAATEPKAAAFSSLEPKAPSGTGGNLDFLLDVPLKVSVQLGGTKMLIRDLLQLGQGSVIELEKQAGEPMDILIGEKLVARGDVVVVNEKFGIRLTDILSPVDRIKQLKSG